MTQSPPPAERCQHRHPRTGLACESRPHPDAQPCSAREDVDGVLCLYAWWPNAAVLARY